MAPIAKVGGLGDVTQSLADELRRRGHDVRVFLPRYAAIKADRHPAYPVAGASSIDVPVSGRIVRAALSASEPAGIPSIYYIENDAYFGRKGIYDDPDTREGYPDSAERFIFFQRAALEALRTVGFRPDVIHCHDQHTALVPAYLKRTLAQDPFFAGVGTVFTIHNLGYQGIYPPGTMALAGFPMEAFYPMSPFEFFDRMNFMKTGITLADVVTTVSPTYAREICTAERGEGLDGVLREKGADLVGILNGIDPDVWNPAKDPALPVHYTAASPAGKSTCREELLKRMSLAPIGGAMLIGIVTRLAEQKGLDLIEAAMERLMGLHVQLAVLGTGQERFHRMLTEAAARWPAKVTVKFGFSEDLAHLIEAGADSFLMPSRYEPCGLNQMYSLRYGTVPVVRATGGLADSVVDADAKGAAGDGFSFTDYTPEAMLDAVTRSVRAFKDRSRWAAIVKRGMERDFTWARSASAYEQVYQRAVARAATRALV
ncbi:MAG: glycogen synthase GlgA [Acidobacteria bacterium]|nr:glycogen synthase GlgA [Acidobacteriota bacterium]